MTVYATSFLRIFNVLTSVDVLVANITSFEETEYTWKGVERDAFDGTILSTLRTPRRQVRLTAEFNSEAEMDAFQNHVGTGIDPLTGAVASLARCLAHSPVPEGGLRVDGSFYCYVHITRKTPWFREEGGVLKTGWRADIELHGTT